VRCDCFYFCLSKFLLKVCRAIAPSVATALLTLSDCLWMVIWNYHYTNYIRIARRSCILLPRFSASIRRCSLDKLYVPSGLDFLGVFRFYGVVLKDYLFFCVNMPLRTICAKPQVIFCDPGGQRLALSFGLCWVLNATKQRS
jgi:hypothetical protein